MIVFVTQIYIEPGCDYPCPHIFQQFVSQEITRRVEMSTSFAQQVGPDFKLIFRMSAKPALEAPEIKGPTVFKKDKDVEFTIFLPFE